MKLLFHMLVSQEEMVANSIIDIFLNCYPFNVYWTSGNVKARLQWLLHFGVVEFLVQKRLPTIEFLFQQRCPAIEFLVQKRQPTIEL